MTAEELPVASPSIDAFQRDRLSYVLPDFTRISWVSDKARATWEPRIQRIGNAWSEIEWRSVVSGIRRCALTSVSAERLIARTAEWAAGGLSTMPVAMSGTTPGYASTSVAPRAGEPFEYRVAVGGLSDVAALKQAIDAGDDGTMGRLLGFPPCCITFFRRVWVNNGCVDTTWAMAANGGSPSEDGRLIEVALEHAVPGKHPVAMDGGARRAPSALLVFLPSHHRLRQPADGSWPRPRVRGRDGVDRGDSQLAGVLVCAARHRPGEDARA